PLSAPPEDDPARDPPPVAASSPPEPPVSELAPPLLAPPLVGPPPVGPFPPLTASAIMLPPAPKSESSDDPASSSVLLQATRQGVAKATIESRGGSDFIDAVYHARESTRRTHLEVRGIEFKTPHGVVIAQVC